MKTKNLSIYLSCVRLNSLKLFPIVLSPITTDYESTASKLLRLWESTAAATTSSS